MIMISGNSLAGRYSSSVKASDGDVRILIAVVTNPAGPVLMDCEVSI